jgi:hypothetical protein
MAVIPALERLKQEELEFQTSLDCIHPDRFPSQKQTNKQNPQMHPPGKQTNENHIHSPGTQGTGHLPFVFSALFPAQEHSVNVG